MLDIKKVQAGLDSSTPEFTCIYYHSLESTNTTAWELYTKSKSTAIVVVTDDQQSGRGRSSNKWYSQPEKSLTFSVLFSPRIKVDQAGLLPLAAGIAIVRTLVKFNIKVCLKWPNDIMFGEKKLGGILCESRVLQECFSAVVLGVGLNINDEIEIYPAAIKTAVTSLKKEFNREFNREQILVNILNELIVLIRYIENGNYKEIQTQWLRQGMYLGSIVSMDTANGTIIGKFKGINQHGEALVENQGLINSINSAEMRAFRET